MGAEEEEIARLQQDRARLTTKPTAAFDADLYTVEDGSFAREIDVGEAEDGDDYDDRAASVAKKLASYTAPKSLLADGPRADVNDEGNVRPATGRERRL